MNPDDLILKHYQKVAENFGLSAESAMQDQVIKCAEIDFLCSEVEAMKRELQRPIRVLDVGCGNGYSLYYLAEKFPEDTFFGVEYTPELYALAAKRSRENYSVWQADCRVVDFFKQPVDLIYTERVLINILCKEQRNRVYENFAKMLQVGSHLIMSESFVETLGNLNRAREDFNLDPLPQSRQNLYLDESCVQQLESFGFREGKTQSLRHHLSTHFYLTRVLHEAFRPKGSRVKGSEFVKFFGLALAPGIGEYSPIQFRSFYRI